MRDADPPVRERLRGHIRGYQVELSRLEGECGRVRASSMASGKCGVRWNAWSNVVLGESWQEVKRVRMM